MSKIEISEELKNLVKKTAVHLYKDEKYEIKKSGFDEEDSAAVLNAAGKELSKDELAKTIDHTILKPEATPDEIKKLCGEAKEYKFASVCINSGYVSLCADLLKGTGVKVCAVIGFPLGATSTKSKEFEAEDALKNGAEEIDMVINIGQLKARNLNYVYNDIKAVTDAAKKHNALSKVIIETCLLTDEEKILACLISKDAGANFVKTSTGFSKGGATVNDVALMKYTVGLKVKVKASGGIRSKEDAIAMITNGADRLGASAGIKIVNGERSESNY